MRKHIFNIISISILFFIWILTSSYFRSHNYLEFSDGAKYASIAKNYVEGRGLSNSFSFFYSNLIVDPNSNTFNLSGIEPVYPLVMSLTFKLFGINDNSVILTSSIFLFTTSLLIFLIAVQFNKKFLGLLAGISILLDINFGTYSIGGGMETFFTTLILFLFWLILKQRMITDYLAILVSLVMYFTKQQAFIYITGALLLYLLLNNKYKLAIIKIAIISIGFLIFDALILTKINGKYYLYSILFQGINVIQSVATDPNATSLLRGGAGSKIELKFVITNIFYNLYNFYKLLPNIGSPYLFALFVLGLLCKFKNNRYRLFVHSVLFTILLTIIVTSSSIPLYRYLHPVLPLGYLLGIIMLGKMVELINKHNCYANLYKFKYLILLTLVFVFSYGKTLGHLFLDSRFSSKIYDKNKPPIYVRLASEVKNKIPNTSIVLTNLDTWGSWYGNKSTVWYPFKPEMIKPEDGQKNIYNAIYLTSYLMDDNNYYMGDEWRQIFYNPENIENDFIRENYQLIEIIEIPAEETYEKQAARAVLLVRK